MNRTVLRATQVQRPSSIACKSPIRSDWANCCGEWVRLGRRTRLPTARCRRWTHFCGRLVSFLQCRGGFSFGRRWTQLMRRSLALFLPLAVFLPLAAGSAQAAVTGSVTNAVLTNYSGIAVEPAGTHAQQARCDYSIHNSGPGSVLSSFSWRFRLLDSGGTPVSITTETGASGTEYRVTQALFLTQGQTDTGFRTAPLVPQQPLVPGASYRVEVRMYQEPSSFLALQTSSGYRFQIVPPDDPPDGAYQLRALVNSTQLLKTYAAATVPAQSTSVSVRRAYSGGSIISARGRLRIPSFCISM